MVQTFIENQKLCLIIKKSFKKLDIDVTIRRYDVLSDLNSSLGGFFRGLFWIKEGGR